MFQKKYEVVFFLTLLSAVCYPALSNDCQDFIEQKTLKIYYAHPVYLYGKIQEERDLELIKGMFPGAEIINPNDPVHDAGYKQAGMEYFEKICAEVDLCIFRGFADLSIGAGIYKELDVFLKKGKPILELPTGLQRRALSVEETREFLRDIGAR